MSLYHCWMLLFGFSKNKLMSTTMIYLVIYLVWPHQNKLVHPIG